MIRPLSRGGAGGPLGQGASAAPRADGRPAGSLAAGFVFSAVVVFSTVSVAGAALGVPLVAFQARLWMASILCLIFCAADVAALRSHALCRITWRRQTPKYLINRYGKRVGPLLWGLDTGLAVTTFRVSAATWAVLSLSVLHLAAWWAGLAYGLGFAAPFVFVTVFSRWRPIAADGTPNEPDWITAGLMRRRWMAQVLNLLALTGVLGVLLTSAYMA